MSKVSIVVPCYKVEEYIRELIESLINQTLSDIEVILVDDGSPDQSGAICDEYASKDSRLRVIHKQNGGVGAARNDGLKAATSDYVIFVDSDDYLPENAIEILYQKARTTDADIVIGDINQVSSDGSKIGRFYAEPFTVTEPAQIRELVRTVFYKNYCPWPYNGKAAFGYGGPCNKLVRKKMLVDNHIEFDLRVKGIYDDIIYSAYILSVAKKISYIPEIVYNYRLLETSITSTYKANTLEINTAIFEAWNDFLSKYNQDGVYTAAFYANVLRRFDESLNKYFFSPKNPNPLSVRLKELQLLMNSEPYKSIPSYVEQAKLEKRHRIECKLLKLGSARAFWFYFNLKGKYRKIVNKG